MTGVDSEWFLFSVRSDKTFPSQTDRLRYTQTDRLRYTSANSTHFFMESTSYVLSFPNGVFLLCDHGLDFLHESHNVRIQSNQSNVIQQTVVFITSTTHHRVSPEFIGSRNCVPIAFTAESPLAQGQ